MEMRGFFGTVALAACAVALISTHTGIMQAGISGSGTALKAMQMESAAFKRAQAEILIDRIIERSISRQAAPIDPKRIKEEANAKIFDALKKLGLEPALCKKAGSTYLKVQGMEGISEIDGITGVLALRLGGATVVQYFASGGSDGASALCALIVQGDFSTLFVLPAGYAASTVAI
ncbi:MAG TPA: hypothetical protein HA254_07515 [Candidatus Diapherotrites archaeon]|uniref:Uncharacterized protein n=1 Tax=Candidatus Iainarchaeum sp. TaxID=3101447 RepID=A0A7J4J247_9ARCH|nr:hypothetical protein [Candidatus Diapherotrites archaeon]